MKEKEIDEILRQAGRAPHPVDPALLDRVSQSIEPSVQPVRSLPRGRVLAGGMVLLCAAVALAGAARSGFFGFEKLGVLDRVLIFAPIAIFAWLAARGWVSAMIPGSRPGLSPQLLLGAGSLALLAVFALIFHDYRTDHFVAQGVVCLVVGLLHAVPAGIGVWFVLRRGFAVDPVAAGLAAGTLAGLAGVSMLELHCANFQAPHIMVWHTAVIPISAAAGALLAWVFRRRAQGQ
ncbi:MAG TPA: NrsF family protein [Bryobacteraceae bacterium]|nr:NrsF family protein [Bryobacteraceae bacterium]